MAHLFRQLYVDEIDFEGITQDKLIDLIFTQFLHRPNASSYLLFMSSSLPSAAMFAKTVCINYDFT